MKVNMFSYIMLGITAVVAIAFLLWVISDIVPYTIGLSKAIKKNNDSIRLKYAEFISNYALNPERYTFDTDCFNIVRYTNEKKTCVIYIYFSFIDAIRFHIWKRKLNKSNKINKQKESYQKYITLVNEDKEK